MRLLACPPGGSPVAAASSRGARRTTARIVVADRNRIDGEGLAALLERQGVKTLAVAISAEEAVRMCQQHRPDVLVLTLTTPSLPGSPLLPTILAAVPGLRVVAVSERGSRECVVLNPDLLVVGGGKFPACASGSDCLHLAAVHGAMGTVRRDADPLELVETVRAAARGATRFEPNTRDAMEAGRGLTRRVHGLSPRQLEVAGLIAFGHSNKEIAARLGVGEPTIKKHVGQVLSKLGLQDRLQAALFVARHPLLFQVPSAD